MNMNEDTKIELFDEDGEKIELYAIEETRINSVDYLLAAEVPDEDAELYILKDISAPEDEDAVYEFVDDEEELEYIGKIFSELLEDEGKLPE